MRSEVQIFDLALRATGTLLKCCLIVTFCLSYFECYLLELCSALMGRSSRESNCVYFAWFLPSLQLSNGFKVALRLFACWLVVLEIVSWSDLKVFFAVAQLVFDQLSGLLILFFGKVINASEKNIPNRQGQLFLTFISFLPRWFFMHTNWQGFFIYSHWLDKVRKYTCFRKSL